MAWNNEPPFAVTQDQVTLLAHDRVVEFLKYPDSLRLADAAQTRLQITKSKVSTCLTPASSASTAPSRKPISN